MPVKALDINPNMMMVFLPNLSANAPPTMLPTRLLIDHRPKIRPTCVIPTLNFCITYSERKGNIKDPPRRSIKVDATRVLNDFGNAKICNLNFLINPFSTYRTRQDIILVKEIYYVLTSKIRIRIFFYQFACIIIILK